VRLIDEDLRPRCAREFDDLLQRRDVAVHREDRVGDDQLATLPVAAPVVVEAPMQVLDVTVTVDETSARQAASRRRIEAW